MKPKKPLAERLTQTMLKQLRTRKLTNAEAAEQLGVSETYLSRTVAAIQEKEPGKTTAARNASHKLYVTRRQTRETLAKKVLAKRQPITLAEAAKQANCSQRTMMRYVAAYRT